MVDGQEDAPLALPELEALRQLARLDAEVIARSRLGRGGPMHLESARRACMAVLSQPILDRYFERMRSRNVPALVIASKLVCGGCRAGLGGDTERRLREGQLTSCPRCARLLVPAAPLKAG